MTVADPRILTLTMTAVSGTIHRFYALLDDQRVIAADGTTSPTYTGEVATPVTLKVRVSGVDNAMYRLDIDLSETAEDQSMTFALSDGYAELQLSL